MNLRGWDTAFALDLALANRALARNRDTLLVDFDTGSEGGLPLRATGAFGDWAIVEGGSGPFVNLRLPIAHGELELSLVAAKTVDLAGVAFVASVALNLIPSTPQSENLRFDVTSAGKLGQQPTAGAITPIRIDDPDNRLDDAEEALLMIALADFVARHADRITFIFATINLVPPNTDGWLTPVRSAFVYCDRGQGAGGSLVILSVTTLREIRDLPREIDPALLSGSYRAAFAISSDLLLANVIMPGLPAVFGHGTTPASFAFDGPNHQILNLLALPMNSIRSGLIDYYPIIRTLRLGITQDALTGRYEGDCDLKAGISMTFWVQPANRIVYDAGTKTLGFLADPNPARGHTAHVPWYWWFAGPLVRLIVEIVVQTISQSIAGSLSANVGALFSLARNPPTSIEWQDTADLVIGAAAVQGDLVMHGDFAALRQR